MRQVVAMTGGFLSIWQIFHAARFDDLKIVT
jgi:hypothetical protein